MTQIEIEQQNHELVNYSFQLFCFVLVFPYFSLAYTVSAGRIFQLETHFSYMKILSQNFPFFAHPHSHMCGRSFPSVRCAKGYSALSLFSTFPCASLSRSIKVRKIPNFPTCLPLCSRKSATLFHYDATTERLGRLLMRLSSE